MMPDMHTLGPGSAVGHWSDHTAKTGCTVVLPPRGNVTSCDIRGSSPGSRELVQLDPKRRLSEVHGILLTGGSAFGLAAADGVMAWLADQGIGYQTIIALVPIVPAAVIFDLGEGDASVRPGHDAGRAACEAATESFETGRIGAGTGATVGKWAGREHAVPGGVGAARVEEQGHVVHALAVVNPIGDVIADDGSVIAGTTSRDPRFMPPPAPAEQPPANTVLTVLTVEAALEKREVQWLASRGSDGATVAVRPAHTRYDGDISFAVAVPPRDEGEPSLDLLGYLATRAVASAIRAAVA